MIVVIPRTDPLCNCGEPDWEWLPRVCPACGQRAIIGHGRRRKQAHDEKHAWIVVRRAICKLCDRTCTVLPAWSLPYTQFSVPARQSSGERYCAGQPLEQAAPTLQDADRIPDASTLRRWFQRRAGSLLWRWRLLSEAWAFRPPTILAWDLRAALRILIPESTPG